MKPLAKLLVFSIAYLFLLLFTSSTQHVYKSFDDTHFEVGDLILAPKMYFDIRGNRAVINIHLDSLRVVADFIRTHPKLKTEIGVHSDTRLTNQYNLELTQGLCKSIKVQMKRELAMDTTMFVMKAYGESQPLIPEEEAEKGSTWDERNEMHFKNSRLEVKILEVLE